MTLVQRVCQCLCTFTRCTELRKEKEMKKFVPREEKGIRNRTGSYAAINKYKSVPGLISIWMGIGVLAGLLLLFVLSYINKGMAGMWIGALGILLIVVAIAAIIVAINGLRDSEALHTRNAIGIVENLLILGGLVFLYVMGI